MQTKTKKLDSGNFPAWWNKIKKEFGVKTDVPDAKHAIEKYQNTFKVTTQYVLELPDWFGFCFNLKASDLVFNIYR